jgi:hypothetical protein
MPNILKQHITTNNMTRYPVKADPIWCGSSYFKLEWQDRQSEGGYQSVIVWNILLFHCLSKLPFNSGGPK